jgi:hypothetical protein
MKNPFHRTTQTGKTAASGPFKSFLSSLTTDAAADWPVILLVFFILIIVFAVVAYLDYVNVSSLISAQSMQPGTTSVNSIIDTGALDKAQADYASRTAQHAALQKGYSGPGDPSF